MKSNATIHAVSFKIKDDILSIGDWQFSRRVAPEVIAFIQQWLDHDPEAELIGKIEEIRNDYTEVTYEESHKAIIAAVRKHDARYGKP